MVILKAFIVSDVCANWFDVWSGDSLRDLSKSDFDYFKSFYGVANLSLVHTFDTSASAFVQYYDDECFDDLL